MWKYRVSCVQREAVLHVSRWSAENYARQGLPNLGFMVGRRQVLARVDGCCELGQLRTCMQRTLLPHR